MAEANYGVAIAPVRRGSSGVSVSIFTFVTAPKLTDTSHEALARWHDLRLEYEEAIKAQCKTTGQDLSAIMVSVRNSFDEALLDTLCEIKWERTKDELTEKFLWDWVLDTVENFENKTVPDIGDLFQQELIMVLNKGDVDAQVTEYFHLCNTIIRTNGLTGLFKRDDGTKKKCKIVVSCLPPKLKRKVKNEIDFRLPEAKSSVPELFKVVSEKALEWDREERAVRSSKRHPPAMKIRLKKGAKPFKTKARKYPPEYQVFLESFNAELVDAGWVKETMGMRSSTHVEEYLHKLEELFGLVDMYGFKLSALKSKLFKSTVKWCGKIIDGKGVGHDPARIQALRDLPYPTNVGELQQFLCFMNWMRDSLVDYAPAVRPLQDALDRAMSTASKRTKRVAAGIPVVLTGDERKVFDAVKQGLAGSAELAFPNPEADKNWSVIEKEAYPIISACDKLSYLLLRPGGFKLYFVTDEGSHFKNQVVAQVARRLGCQQNFVLAYSPWINGSIERLNRDIV
ncbi:hypothetical protein P43SY_008614 [Pythium insidiosum]|uniref:Integrase catalytic domain-containing protein n=1 Tax=Pythium insidiosum TaxID=114742 RepID=A0AAD5Q6C7_PYTIN|nr:hypothetical protein P43SY_008614 [Pythium insidiosum]